MPITLDPEAFPALGTDDADRRDAEGGGVLDAEVVMIQFLCSTDGAGTQHDPDARPDAQVRPEHAALHGSVWRIDDPNAPVPPLDYGCRCAIRYVARRGSPAASAGALPESPSPPIATPEAAYRRWLDAHAPGWKDVANAMAQAPAGDELAAGHLAATRLKIPGDRRAVVRMIARTNPRAQPGPPPPVRSPAPAPVPNAPVPGPPTPARGRPEWLPEAPNESRPLHLDGTPPPVAGVAGPPPPAPIAAERIESAERAIAGRPTERNVILSASGELIEAQEGNAHSAPISGRAQVLGRGGIMTHNHPLDPTEGAGREWFNPPSEADVALALTMDLQAVRAVTPNGLVYQVGPPVGGWQGKHVGNPFGHRSNRARVRGWLVDAYRDPVVLERVRAAMAAGVVPAGRVRLLHQHLALVHLAERGKISYTVGRYAD